MRAAAGPLKWLATVGLLLVIFGAGRLPHALGTGRILLGAVLFLAAPFVVIVPHNAFVCRRQRCARKQSPPIGQ